MKWSLLASAVVPATGVMAYLAGLFLPARRTSSVKIEIHAQAERVWEILTDWKNQAAWRSGLLRVEVLSPDSFVEHPERGGAIAFRIASATPPRQIDLEMSGAVTGTYAATLSDQGGVTVFQAKESIVIANPLIRLLNRLFFDLDGFTGRYAMELKQRAEGRH